MAPLGPKGSLVFGQESAQAGEHDQRQLRSIEESPSGRRSSVPMEEAGEAAKKKKPKADWLRLENSAPWLCVVLGVAMIVVAAFGYLDASVSIANE
jgi:hypothetical protein